MKIASSIEPAKVLGGRMDEAALNKILDKLDGTCTESGTACNRRQDERYSYRRALQIEMRQPSGGAVATRIMSRDISKEGMAFLHNAYVHVGTQCKVQLVTTHNNWHVVDGRVCRCAYVENGWHIVGLKFSQAIDLAAFASGVIRRRILVVDDDRFMRQLVGILLTNMRSEAVFAENGEDAITKINNEIFDLVLMDIDMPVLDGAQAIQRLRAAGYTGKVVAATAMNAPGDRERLMAMGFTGFLPKPVVKKSLADLLGSVEEEPLFSSLSSEESLKELINEFVAGMSARVRMLEQALAEKNTVGLTTLVRALRGEAGSYGFDPITQAAQVVEDGLAAKRELASLHKEVIELVRLCSAARPTAIS